MKVQREMNRLLTNSLICDMKMAGGEEFEGLSYLTLQYLDLIYYRGGSTVSELSQLLGLDKSTVSKKIDEMAKQGLIVKTRDAQDGRRVLLSLHPEAEALERTYERPYQQAANKVEQALSPAELKAVCRALRRYADALLE